MNYIRAISFALVICSVLGACKNTSYPCPAYNENPGKDATMKVGPDGTPMSSVSRQYDDNGLIKKKKVKRIHK